jgi:uncharacterized protein YbjT (DUF2867 family)
MKRILVTGATGRIGRQVVSQLVKTGALVRALSRTPETAQLPSEVEVLRGDLNVPASLDKCLRGVDIVFLIWTASPNAVSDAVKLIVEHAKRVVFLSAPHRTPHPFFQQPNPIAAMHSEIESLIEASGISWTFLRPGMFAANALLWWAPQIRAGNVVRWVYGAAPTAPIHERDIAAVAVRTLIDAGHESADYVLTGPESITQLEQIKIISEVIGRSLHFEEMTPEDAKRELPYPPTAVNMLLNAWAAAIGQPAFVTSQVEEITGTPALTFHKWVTEHAIEFQA